MSIPTRRRRQQIIDEYGFSSAFMDIAVSGLRKYPDRYRNAVIRSGKTTMIDLEMFWDWLKYRDALEVNTTVPLFRREEYQ